jgi:hypothetical protein
MLRRLKAGRKEVKPRGLLLYITPREINNKEYRHAIQASIDYNLFILKVFFPNKEIISSTHNKSDRNRACLTLFHPPRRTLRTPSLEVSYMRISFRVKLS